MYFGPQAGFTLEELLQLSATGITTPLTIKNGLSQGVYKFTVSLVDLDGNVLVSSGRFSIVVGPDTKRRLRNTLEARTRFGVFLQNYNLN